MLPKNIAFAAADTRVIGNGTTILFETIGKTAKVGALENASNASKASKASIDPVLV